MPTFPYQLIVFHAVRLIHFYYAFPSKSVYRLLSKNDNTRIMILLFDFSCIILYLYSTNWIKKSERCHCEERSDAAIS